MKPSLLMFCSALTIVGSFHFWINYTARQEGLPFCKTATATLYDCNFHEHSSSEITVCLIWSGIVQLFEINLIKSRGQDFPLCKWSNSLQVHPPYPLIWDLKMVKSRPDFLNAIRSVLCSAHGFCGPLGMLWASVGLRKASRYAEKSL